MKENDKVWYACYGSNLCAERFMYYIVGGHCPFNDKDYDGCRDKTMWTESKIRKFPGDLYFANVSRSWGKKGVAFYDPNGSDMVVMRLYKITWGQLNDVQDWEGRSAKWYGNLVLLGSDEDGLPIYTFTSAERSADNPPHENYISLIRDALVTECGLSKEDAAVYLENACHSAR